ncbi:MAG TPA: hypothetical protein DDW33_03375 [Ktedonobacter sp.]|jgi:hypothetical protein|nr:hypothetical protein [Ktedonobacter sp.]HAT44602.1 hypothetical protein [Ktedonobacter sp.]HBE24711.1 hypothetical protein [Ktedonobacter sp.]HCJ36430.1 hypothetical protein [Ktedonobacter sp.]HCP73547.1 hypothetical protein [Ktedonobacter sp.]
MVNWHKFVSLAWYDSFIEFLFRFVAKTSEPLLAAGLVISAADFLSKGALMHSNPELTMLWAWTQAIAIEASSGVVFVYALQSFKQHDKIKAWVYLVLSLLLAITGGAMLLFQLIANTTGLQENSLPVYLFYALAGLRVLVSVSYVYLCRAKYIRFTDLEDETQAVSPETPSALSDEVMNTILEKLQKLDHLEQALSAHSITVSQVQEQLLAIPETAGVSPETEGDEASLQAQLERLLSLSPEISTREAAAIVGKPHSTVGRHMLKMRQSA